MKYESPVTCHSKDMANVKVFEKWVKLQGQGQKVNKMPQGHIAHLSHIG
jgi:hypothetical protein